MVCTRRSFFFRQVSLARVGITLLCVLLHRLDDDDDALCGAGTLGAAQTCYIRRAFYITISVAYACGIQYEFKEVHGARAFVKLHYYWTSPTQRSRP